MFEGTCGIGGREVVDLVDKLLKVDSWNLGNRRRKLADPRAACLYVKVRISFVTIYAFLYFNSIFPSHKSIL